MLGVAFGFGGTGGSHPQTLVVSLAGLRQIANRQGVLR